MEKTSKEICPWLEEGGKEKWENEVRPKLARILWVSEAERYILALELGFSAEEIDGFNLSGPPISAARQIGYYLFRMIHASQINQVTQTILEYRLPEGVPSPQNE